MADRKIVLYISEMVPVDTQASCVVTYRHLRALERQGFEIGVVTREDAEEIPLLPRSWTRILVPARRWHYPPYRPVQPLRLIRWLLLDREVLPRLDRSRVHCVVSLLQGEYLAAYACWLSRRVQRPLFYFYHDRGEWLHHSGHPRRAARLRRQNLSLLGSRTVRRVWTVCPELVYDEPRVASKFRTVYPLPETFGAADGAAVSASPPSNPILAYTGSIYNEVMPQLGMIAATLAEFGGRLHLCSHLEKNARLLQSRYPETVVFEGDFTTERSCRLVQSRRAAFVIAYPSDTSLMPWCVDCFPSKLTQLVQTGLPGLVLAPASTALGKWCLRTGWTLFRPNVDRHGVESLLKALTDPICWRRAVNDSVRAAREEFNPARLEQIVNDDVCLAG